MISLYVRKNVVYVDKRQENYQNFVNSFLVKYESVTVTDYMNSTKAKRKFKTVKERRDLYTENENYVIFSRGILEMIPPTEYTAVFSEDDSEVVTPRLSFDEIRKTLDVYDLRDDQVVAVNKCLLLKRGVIQLPTATGKSSIISSVTKRLIEYNPEMRILVLAPTLSTVKNINKTFERDGLNTAIFGHPSKSITTPVTTSLVQTLMTVDDEKELEQIDAVIYDECLPANSKILLPDGSQVKIADIYSDDSITEVLSYNVEESLYEPKKILRKFKTPFDDRFCKVYYKDINDKLQGVTCTLNHKIYCKGRGYVEAQSLQEDDLIKVDYPFARNWNSLNQLTYRKVVRVTPNVGKVAAYKYNIEVEDNHNYFANNVLVSNCHHLKCDTWNKLNTMLPNVEYSLGFSALSIDREEVTKQDFRELSYDASLIVGSSGRVVMHMDPSYYIQKGIIALPVILRVSNRIMFPEGFDESNWHKVVKTGLMSTDRTDKIARTASMFSRHKRRVLILVSEKDYAFTICRFLVHYGVTDFGISFGAGSGFLFNGFNPPTDDSEDFSIDFKKEDSLKVLDKLSTGEVSVLIATSHLDEGVDVNELDACILACGGKKDRRIIQRVGRVLRKSKTGKYAYVVDFTDSGSSVLSRQSRTRLSMYKEDIGVPSENIFDGIEINSVERKFLELEGLI